MPLANLALFRSFVQGSFIFASWRVRRDPLMVAQPHIAQKRCKATARRFVAPRRVLLEDGMSCCRRGLCCTTADVSRQRRDTVRWEAREGPERATPGVGPEIVPDDGRPEL